MLWAATPQPAYSTTPAASSSAAMASAAAEALSRRLGAAVRGLSGAWYGRHMASAESAIRTRLALVDLVLEVRDARIPASSAFEPLCRPTLEPDGRRVIVLNKADLADPSETKKWIAYMKQRSCSCIAINSHNMESIKELLNIVRSRMREIKHGQSNCTGTVLLVGIPNVGKSAIVNVMHQIGRIAAAEKGKLKHAIVSGHPGETRDISGYKERSKIPCYRRANVSFSITSTSRSQNKKRQYVSDHTQDFVVKSVRQILFDSVSSFKGGPGKEDAFSSLIDCQMVSLQEAFKVSTESSEDMRKSVALKLLNLYRTGRLGHYTLDHVPDDWQEVAA
ncbi:hypothetical protein QOZ80_2AG0117600 [Eleusine coracana subsp. coracana]|nr:hypothetical protein QOZ80_2AG0117600 [Eleusine coracana subsp. coracana]